jgi:hypothetical protein
MMLTPASSTKVLNTGIFCIYILKLTDPLKAVILSRSTAQAKNLLDSLIPPPYPVPANGDQESRLTNFLCLQNRVI